MEPCVGTVCQHKFGIMFEANTVTDEETFLFLSFFFLWNAGKNVRVNDIGPAYFTIRKYLHYITYSFSEPYVCEHKFGIMF